jgi:hypothetical protein
MVEGQGRLVKPKLTAEDVTDRIVYIREQLQSLIDDVGRAAKGPDTDRLIECKYSVGPPTGLWAALDALESLDEETVRRALQLKRTQMARRADPETRKIRKKLGL